jgi:hypothetical protein
MVPLEAYLSVVRAPVPEVPTDLTLPIVALQRAENKRIGPSSYSGNFS